MVMMMLAVYVVVVAAADDDNAADHDTHVGVVDVLLPLLGSYNYNLLSFSFFSPSTGVNCKFPAP